MKQNHRITCKNLPPVYPKNKDGRTVIQMKII